MKRIIFMVGLLVAFSAHAATFTWARVTGAARSTVGTGAVTDTFAGGSTDGMALSGVEAFQVTVEAASGQTITTKIELIAYVQDPYTLRWSRAPRWDIPNGNGITGARSQYMDGFIVDGGAGRVAYVPSAGAVSGGSLSIRITAQGPDGTLL